MKVLVTGASGFIGSHVTETLVASGIEVRAVDIVAPESGIEGAEFLRGDIRDPAFAESAVAGVDAVSHQAAKVGLGVSVQDVTDYVSVNDAGTATLLAALDRAGSAGRFVLAGSMVVYGEGVYRCANHGIVRAAPRRAEDLMAGRFEVMCPDCGNALDPLPVTEEAPADPRNFYAATKLHQEHLCEVFGRETGVQVIALRYHNVYGPRMPRDTPYAGVASIFRSALERGEAPEVFEDGHQLRDFIHVSDVAAANLAALTAGPDASGPLNIATGEPHSIGELARALASGDAPDPRVTGAFRLGDVRHVFASPARAEEVLGFRAAVPFAEGMERFASEPLRA